MMWPQVEGYLGLSIAFREKCRYARKLLSCSVESGKFQASYGFCRPLLGLTLEFRCTGMAEESCVNRLRCYLLYNAYNTQKVSWILPLHCIFDYYRQIDIHTTSYWEIRLSEYTRSHILLLPSCRMLLLSHYLEIINSIVMGHGTGALSFLLVLSISLPMHKNSARFCLSQADVFKSIPRVFRVLSIPVSLLIT